VKDGVGLARTYGVPDEVLRFIPEHHGTSLIKYFYMQALEHGTKKRLLPTRSAIRAETPFEGKP